MIQLSDFIGVAVLYNYSLQLIKGEAQDILAENGVVQCAHAISNALKSEGINVELAPITEEAEQTLSCYQPDKWVIYNLAEGFSGRLFEEARIAWLLETSGYHFTGNGGAAIAHSTNKALTKSLLVNSGLDTPAWWLFNSADSVSKFENYPFPLFVKPVAEDASQGIGYESVVSNYSTLRDRVAYLAEHYCQSVLVEEFIPGREINAAVWGDPLELLPLAEIDFREFDRPEQKIVNFSAKWQEDSFEYHHTPSICPADLSPSLKRRVSQAALRAVEIIGAQGYARVDIRLSDQGVPYILEVNCNPDISPEAGFFHAVEQTGLQYQDMARKILSLARRLSDVYNPARIPE